MSAALAPSIPRAPVNKWLVAVSIAFGSLMATIDSSIVNVAMPNIRGELGASIQEITWISTAYMIAMVLVMPLTGFLGGFFGQKRVYLTSMVMFVAGSALCGTARSLPALVIYRVLQGFGGVVLLLGAYLTWRQTQISRAAGREELRLSREGQLPLRLAYNLFTQKPKAERDDFLRWTASTRYQQGDDYFRLNGGELFVEVAEVVRDLWRRERERGLSAGEKRMLAKARDILVGEVALAEKSTKDEAEVLLDKVLTEA